MCISNGGEVNCSAAPSGDPGLDQLDVGLRERVVGGHADRSLGVHQVHDRRVLGVAGVDVKGRPSPFDQRLVTDLARGEIDAALVRDRGVAVHGGAARLHDGGRDERPLWPGDRRWCHCSR